MSESESIATHASQNSVPRTGADDVVQRLGARVISDREGLPKSYRMRADAHYVDQLEAPAQPGIRLLATHQIDWLDLPSPERVEALTTSIASHGVLQPLLIRRQGGRYSLIAGRKRLAAAMAAGLTEVPCLLHEVESREAAALAAADNLRVDDSTAPAAPEKNPVRPLLQAVAVDLATIWRSTELLKAARTGGLTQQVGPDLIEAHASHAAWLVSCLLGTFENTRLSPLGAIIQRVSEGFEAHAKLSGLQLDCSVTAAAAVCKLPEEAATTVIRGAIFATLSYAGVSAKPRIEVHADIQSRTLKIEVVQRLVRVPPDLHSHIDEDFGRPADLIAALALRMARMVAAPHGGSAELTPLPGAGSVMQITFAHAQATP